MLTLGIVVRLFICVGKRPRSERVCCPLIGPSRKTVTVPFFSGENRAACSTPSCCSETLSTCNAGGAAMRY